jgi:hypothetical protein
MRWLLVWIAVLIASTALSWRVTAAVLAPASPHPTGDDRATVGVPGPRTCSLSTFGSFDWWLHDTNARGGPCTPTSLGAANSAAQGDGCLSRNGAYNAWLYTNSPRGVCERPASPTPSERAPVTSPG